MSDTLNARAAITRPNSVREIKNDIKCKEAAADFVRHNIFKWAVLVLLILILASVTLLFLFKLFTDLNFQNSVIAQVENNIVFIILTALTILGLKIPKRN